MAREKPRDACPPEEAIGRAVAIHRGRQNIFQRELAGTLAALGDGALGDAQLVSKVERGLRGVTIDEWLLLASALRVPPLALLFPPELEAIVTPVGSEISPQWGWKWASGESPGPGPGQGSTRLKPGRVNTRHALERNRQWLMAARHAQEQLDLRRRADELYAATGADQSRLEAAELTDDEVDELEERVSARLAEVELLEPLLSELDLPPFQYADYRDVDRALHAAGRPPDGPVQRRQVEVRHEDRLEAAREAMRAAAAEVNRVREQAEVAQARYEQAVDRFQALLEQKSGDEQ